MQEQVRKINTQARDLVRNLKQAANEKAPRKRDASL
jgi:hypothetical protein